MKRELFVTMIAMCVAGSACLAAGDAPTADAAAPKIAIDRMVYDFGATSMVSKLSGSFVISNAGTALLELKKPTTSCGCTVAALKTDKLAPGETTSLGFTMNVNSGAHGPLEKRITVPSNDPKSPSLLLTVKAHIVPVYDYSPTDVMFGDLHLGATTNFTVQVKRTDGKALSIAKVESTYPGSQGVHAKLEMAGGVTNAATVRIEIAAEGSARRFNDVLGLYVGDGKAPVMTIPISGRFVGDVAFEPEAIYWAILDPSDWPGKQGAGATTKRVRITSNVADTKFEVTNPVSSSPDVKVSINPVEEGKAFELVAVVDKAPKEPVRGMIKVDTNLKGHPTVEIPFTVNVIRPRE